MNVGIIVGSTREGRKTIRVARWIENRLRRREGVEVSFVDLEELDLPVMRERVRFSESPPESALKLSETIQEADSLLIVTPEYNHGYPGVLKNAIDYLLPEYKRKPVGIVTVSAGPFGGLRCLEALRQTMFGIGAIPVSAELPITKVQDSFDEHGEPTSDAWDRRLDRFLSEFFWLSEAIVAKKHEEEEKSS
ncbi:MAG: NAD(P)H-dependent oxidoreductase [Thermoanaerobaculia bacterium]|nr:NAD(P)H-dependent oxidoreductase [Thermoanaerobaculia bacterium]